MYIIMSYLYQVRRKFLVAPRRVMDIKDNPHLSNRHSNRNSNSSRVMMLKHYDSLISVLASLT